VEASSHSRRTVRVGNFELHVPSGELRSNGQATRLSEQPLQILLLLLERPGEVVTREQFRERLWAADTFVDFDTGLNSGVKRLREALVDSAEHPMFIETLPRRGYRLIALVEDLETRGVPVKGASVRRRIILIGAATAALICAGIAASRLVRPPPPKIESIAVLPLTNLTADRAEDYFADGMTEALITELAQLRNLRVISRTSTLYYKNTQKSLPQIAKELNVDAIVEGTVTRAGSRVRITAQLIYGPADRHLWAGSYEREVGDILILQRELAQAVAQAVRIELNPEGRALRATPQINPQAYESFLRARGAAGKQSPEGFKEAIAYVQDAVSRQPDFASAWSAMASYYMQGAFVGLLSPQECQRRGEVAARKALELDPTLPDAHTVLGNILYRFHWNWPRAEGEFRRALDLAPGDADAHRAYSVLLALQGRSEEAVGQAQQAIALDPLSLQAMQDLGRAFRSAGRYDQAVAAYQKALAVDPNVPRAHFQLGRTYLLAGQIQKGTAELETAVELSKRNPRYVYYLGHAYGSGGRVSDARRILEELKRKDAYISPVGLALVQTGLGDREAALNSLEAAYQQRAFELNELRETSEFESLYAEPRFQQLMRRIGLPPR